MFVDSNELSKQMRDVYGDDMVHCSLCVNKDCKHRDELDGGCYAGRELTDYEIFLWYGWDFGKWCFIKSVKTKKEILEFLQGKENPIFAVAKDGIVISEHIGILRNNMSQPKIPVEYATLKKAKISYGKAL